MTCTPLRGCKAEIGEAKRDMVPISYKRQCHGPLGMVLDAPLIRSYTMNRITAKAYPHVTMHRENCRLVTDFNGSSVESVLLAKMAMHNAWIEQASPAAIEVVSKFHNANYFAE